MLTASSDLVALARSQIILLTQSLGAISSVMYITEEVANNMPPPLIEVVSYPQGAIEELQPNSVLSLPAQNSSELVRQGRIVVPLLYQDAILGFLVTGRKDREWTSEEQLQIQQVANTLAIACALDRRCQWLEANQRQAYAQQQDFIDTLLHQLRNPLTALKTFAKLLLRRVTPEDPNYKTATGILREAGHIQDLLAEADKYTPPKLLQATPELALLPAAELDLCAINLNEILEPLVISASAIAQDRNLNFNSYIPADLPIVLANAGALREVLGNLVDNAIKYTMPNPNGSVNLSVQVGRDYVTILVQDTGVGIPATDLPRLFERNFRGQQANSDISGTGLGLAIAKDLIEKMEGEIHVDSQPNRGSTFSVSLKRYTDTSYIDM